MNRFVYLDSDGVMADFDKRAQEILGVSSSEFEEKNGTKRFWKALFREGEFYYDLEPMPDAKELYDYVSQNYNHAILTGVPFNKESTNQKVRWYRKNFGSVAVICCLAREKHLYCVQGDILIDDRDKYRKDWEDAGGIFIHHKFTQETIKKLKEIDFIDVNEY